MDPKKSLNEIYENNEILKLNKKDALKLSRIEKIEDIIKLSKGIQLEDKRVLNPTTIKVAIFIIEKIKNILELNPDDIKESTILNIVNKIGDELIKKGNVEDYIIGMHIQNIALKIENIHLRYERALNGKNSMIDPLTGLANRRFIEKEIIKQIEIKNRYGTDTSILIIDIDFFKKINDTFGHDIGDKALIEISRIFKEIFRLNDIIGRWGGEEFLILMPGTRVKEAEYKANELRKQIQDNLLKSINIKSEEKITVSIGVSQIEEGASIGKHAIKRADHALYISKKEGRNKVTIECPTECSLCEKAGECEHANL